MLSLNPNVEPTSDSGNAAKLPVSRSAKGYVVAQCPRCKQKKKYDMSRPLNHTPMCDKCFGVPMLVKKVVLM